MSAPSTPAPVPVDFPSVSRRVLRHSVIVGALFAQWACSAEAASVAAPEVPGIDPPVVVDTAGNGAVRAALLIDPANLPVYAGVGLPSYYTPALLQREDRTPLNNPLTNAGATLGRVLFFDTRLSINQAVSCASCHAVDATFGDSARFSLGFDGVRRTDVHSMRLVNARFNESARYFWDRRAPTLEAQTTQPVQNELEMGFDAAHGGLDAALARLRGTAFYGRLFKLAFGDSTIVADRVQRALAQYVRAITSTQSRWDLAYAQVAPPANLPPNFLAPLPGFTAEETHGQQLFIQPVNAGGAGCAGCHVPPTFSLSAASRSNGLDAGETRIFRSPSLKNVGLSRHFMHDGRFNSLEAVVAFYNAGVQAGPATDPRLLTGSGQPRRLNLSAADQAALVAFMRTLNDSSVLADPRFVDPFRR